ncbi:MAG: nuclear transport factor 2 family protein [Candidatus Dormiibacterota bacterium]
MADEGTRHMVESYMKALFSNTRNADLAPYVHPDFIEDWPQSGERIRGIENQLAVRSNYPDEGEIGGELRSVVGSKDQWVTTPSLTLLKIVGTGDTYTATGWSTYPNGDHYHIISILQLRDGKIARSTTFFAAPFEAAEWRKQWVEAIPKE